MLRHSKQEDLLHVTPGKIYVGCAGWNIPRDSADRFVETGSHLCRYATRFTTVEINSSFYRRHLRATYERWAKTVGSEFRFSVKMPKVMTHELRLKVPEQQLQECLADILGLGDKLGCLLVQLPPSLTFDSATATHFFGSLRQQASVAIACEPRHATWFSAEAEELLRHHQVARVAADPKHSHFGDQPGGWSKVAYFRLHGSPVIYRSNYHEEFLTLLAERLLQLQQDGRDCWCIFDNTAAGAAIPNALDLLTKVGKGIVTQPPHRQ